MSKKKNDQKTNPADIVTLADEATSIIDMGAIRRAQAQEYASDEELAEHDASHENLAPDAGHDHVENLRADATDDAEARELSLDEEAALIRQELDADPELKRDVLLGYRKDDSDENLDNIAAKIKKQEKAQLEQYQGLADEVSEELKDFNDLLILEDKLLETSLAQEADQGVIQELAASAARAKKIKKPKKAAPTIDQEKDGSAEAFAIDVPGSDFSELNLSDANEEEAVEIEEMSEEAAELKAALPQIDADGNYPLEDLQSCIEALLFYSDRPVSLKKLKEMLEMTEAEDAPILEALEGLKAQFAAPLHGFEIAEIAGGYQLRTKLSKAPLLRKLAKIQVQRLSRGAMETLTIVSYQQPCTKDEIDKVRGVDSSHFIRTLLDRKLIEVSGRSEAAGRPMIYSTTDIFLEVFGLMNLQGLPPLREIEAMVPQMAAAEEGAEDPRVIQMRKMVHQMKEDSNHLDYNAKEDDQILQEIRERVKAIDISTPYLERQKQLAAEGITGAEAEEVLTREFNFAKATSGGEVIVTENAEETSTEESTDQSVLDAAHSAQQSDLLSDEELSKSHEE
jgi:segregation and condensation protein B